MIAALSDHPLLLLFLVSAIGYPLGRLRVCGSSLGITAVLFVGLAFGALDPSLELPETVYSLGLVVFVYTVGLASANGFFGSFRRDGLRDNFFVIAILGAVTLVAAVAGPRLGFSPGLTAGLYSGALTNAPALAAVLEHLGQTGHAGVHSRGLAEPVIGLSLAYPMGVVGMIAVVMLAQRVWRIDYRREAARLQASGHATAPPETRTVRVTREAVAGLRLQRLVEMHGWHVVFGRVRHLGQVSISSPDTALAVGDELTIVGAPPALDAVVDMLGEPSPRALERAASDIDTRRIFVSNRAAVGRPLADLQIPARFGALVTRVRRGDVDLLADGDLVLQLGDRVRVLAESDRLPDVTAFFGDSYRAVSEVDVLAFSLGPALGLVLGLLPVPLPGGLTLRLGLAGGPLVVALVLGRLGRTGPFVWTLPYSANLTLRQIGLVFFLAGVGTRSGWAFRGMLAEGGGLTAFAAGGALTVIAGGLTVWVGYRILRIPMGRLTGMLAGLQTQPAVLAFALEQSGDEAPNKGYAAVYPVALIAKIVYAQLLLAILGG